MYKIFIITVCCFSFYAILQQNKIAKLKQENIRLAHNVEVLEQAKISQAVYNIEVKNYQATLEKQLKDANETINLLLEDIYTSGQMKTSSQSVGSVKTPRTAKNKTRDKLYELYNSPF